jgi:uncharacterized protein YndB with AHSA1/START domain
LLADAPRPVGEVATALGLRQPQATKHLQTLERAGLVTMQPLGRRRIYALRRARLGELRAWLERFEHAGASDAALDEYARVVAAEQRAAAADPAWAEGRVVRVARTIAAPPAAVWDQWTRAEHVRRWWAPEHFSVAECEVDAVKGGRLRIVIAEGDGTRHEASGRFTSVRRPRALRFELAPLGPDGAPLFNATHDVRFARHDAGTELAMDITIHDARVEAAPAIAGIEMGWRQLFDKLAREAESSPPNGG